MKVAFGADGRDISMIGNNPRIDSCIGAPVMGFISTSSITTLSLSCCCGVHYDTGPNNN